MVYVINSISVWNHEKNFKALLPTEGSKAGLFLLIKGHFGIEKQGLAMRLGKEGGDRRQRIPIFHLYHPLFSFVGESGVHGEINVIIVFNALLHVLMVLCGEKPFFLCFDQIAFINRNSL